MCAGKDCLPLGTLPPLSDMLYLQGDLISFTPAGIKSASGCILITKHMTINFPIGLGL